MTTIRATSARSAREEVVQLSHSVHAEPETAYEERRNDDPMVAAYRANAESLGRVFTDAPMSRRRRMAGSTGMANVSLRVPAIHPTQHERVVHTAEELKPPRA
ncbi:hypothetical protein [Kocuria tytonicola]|uniref:hypothetical protein n=1 Tax=Kocuria tytonicola TaxID=2055946 RepID=UPI001981881B|nr:hypothetical protein [Kocuria tytonicola]